MSQPAANPDELLAEPEADMMRIIVATDIHLGYNEKDPVRGNDSFVSFEEILAYARRYRVDFVLLGGDLFHENKPTRTCLHRTMELMREYCFGDRPVRIQIVSDQSLAFHSRFKRVNYEDPNFNVEVPLFAIHGNHDDPAGEGGLAALDILSAANLVNYFGKAENVDDITIHPILFTKGTTKLALYGLGAIRDERLHRTFADKKVRFMRPVEAREDWFNLFVFHQNRLSHSPKNYIPEAFLADFLNLVIWGHEHECLLVPQESAQKEVMISQPGSSVATSLHESEVGKKYTVIPFFPFLQALMRKLHTVRPFVTGDAVLSEEPDLKGNKDAEAVMLLLANKVQTLIEQAKLEWPRQHDKAPELPLIRLRVDLSGGFDKVNVARFGQRFVGKVANPADILLFHKRKAERAVPKASAPKGASGAGAHAKAAPVVPQDRVSVEQLIRDELARQSVVPDILLETEFGNALHAFVEKDEKSAIGDFVNKVLEQTQRFLRDEDPSHMQTPEEIAKLVVTRTANLRLDESQSNDVAGDLPAAGSGGDEDSDGKTKERNDDEDEVHGPEYGDGQGHSLPLQRASSVTAKANAISLLDDDGGGGEDNVGMMGEANSHASKKRNILQFMTPVAPAKKPKPAAAAKSTAPSTPEEKKRKTDVTPTSSEKKATEASPAPPPPAAAAPAAAKAKLLAPSISLWGGAKKR